MPELPEIEGMRRRLGREIVGRKVVDAEDLSGTALRSVSGVPFREAIAGVAFTGTGRRAKNLLLSLSTGDTLVMHFMRDGMLELVPGAAERRPHTQAVLRLDDGRELRLRDTMRRARWTLCQGVDTSLVSTLQGLGPEYDSPEFTVEYLRGVLKGRSPVKALLIDQALIAGIGNGWSHEICHAARIHPARPGGEVTDEEAARLYEAIRAVFDRAIAARDASTLDVMGDEGWEVAGVHRRKGKPCPTCGAAIVAQKLGAGQIYYCPECQK